MDASALLKSQGWRGSGHSLHKTDDSIGLAKPILVSRKNNTLGIGRKNHVTSDQWWLNAFDEQLKSLDTSGKTSIVQTKENTKLAGLLTVGAGKYSGANALYACFVSGGLLQGTVKPNTKEGESTDTTPEAEVAPPARKETKAERRARKEEKRKRKAEREARRLRKAEKRAKKTASAGASASEKSESKDKSKKTKKATDNKKKSGKKGAVPDTKEERRARKEEKRKRRDEKQKRRKVEGG
ncbi:hypothetical protein VMCG_08361 [Cytospora schulzeri]|uniref:G-patch domain-containing protein n=1 Tax=Cytospora schulzeri TaxID=448051 RepID=A0A423VV90_9PEZI|nr:hypothetical protein VMCG_08361 [Valsa malicola]